MFLRKRQLALRSLIVIFALCGQSWAKKENQERTDRLVDRAALGTQKLALSKFEKLLKKYRNTPREPLILAQIANGQQRASAIEFRIAHAEAARKQQPVDLTKYNKTLESVIETTSILVKNFSKSQDIEIEPIFFMRGQAYQELKKKELAKKDFTEVLHNSEVPEWKARSAMVLGDMAIEDNDHPGAIRLLKLLEQWPEDPHYPFALHKIGWSYYNLDNYPEAVAYVEKLITFWNERMKAEEEGLLDSELGFRHNAMMDLALFYFGGFEKKVSGFSLEDAIPTFKKYEPGADLGKMEVRMAELLRSRTFDDELIAWKEIVLKETSRTPETLQVIMLNFEHQFNRRRWKQVKESSADFIRLDKETDHKMRQYEAYPRAQKLIADVANRWQKTISTKKVEATKEQWSILADLYLAFTRITDDRDPKSAQAHYNLAEVKFRIADYDMATQEYQWLVDHWYKKNGLNLAEVRLKILGSRYQILLQKDWLPKKLEPGKLAGGRSPDWGKLQKPLAEWIGWIDDYRDDFGHKDEAFQGMEFEGNRAIYGAGQTHASVNRLISMLEHFPDAKFAVPAASLILDTYLLTENWEDVEEVSDHMLAILKVKDKALMDRLAQARVDAAYKLLEDAYKKEDYRNAMRYADRYLSKYGSTPRAADCLFLASRSALKVKDEPRSLAYLSKLLTQFPNGRNRAQALLAKATLEEGKYDLDAAATDYAAYLEALDSKTKDSESHRSEITAHVALLRAISAKQMSVECKGKPGSKEAIECDRYEALNDLKTGTAKHEYSEKVTDGYKENRALWAAVALALDYHKPKTDKWTLYKMRLGYLKALASGWDGLDPLGKFVTIPVLMTAVPQAMIKGREELDSVAPLKPTSNAIARRIEFIKTYENTAGAIIKLPWAKPKTAALVEVSHAYTEFSTKITELAPPKGLSGEDLSTYKKTVMEISAPFMEKGKKLLEQAKEVAMEAAVDPDSVGLETGARTVASQMQNVDMKLMGRLGGNAEFAPENKESAMQAKKLWADALGSRMWARAFFFLQEFQAKQKNGTDAELMRAISLNAAGAGSESYAVLETLRGKMEGSAKRTLARVLLSNYERTLAMNKAEGLKKELGLDKPQTKQPNAPSEPTNENETSKE